MPRDFFSEECDALDASVFNGDALMDKEKRLMFRSMLRRWEKKLDEWDEISAGQEEIENTPERFNCEVCGALMEDEYADCDECGNPGKG